MGPDTKWVLGPLPPVSLQETVLIHPVTHQTEGDLSNALCCSCTAPQTGMQRTPKPERRSQQKHFGPWQMGSQTRMTPSLAGPSVVFPIKPNIKLTNPLVLLFPILPELLFLFTPSKLCTEGQKVPRGRALQGPPASALGGIYRFITFLFSSPLGLNRFLASQTNVPSTSERE